MKLAYVMSENFGETDRILSDFARTCVDQGMRISGIVQTNRKSTDRASCDMDVQVLPNGATYRISQSLGSGARGCRLDPAELERAAFDVKNSLELNPTLLVLNKFGKMEAEGRGFREIVAQAVMADIPVITAVNAINLPAFLEFTGGAGELLDANLTSLEKWLDSQVHRTPA